MSPRVSLRSPGAVWRIVFDGQSLNNFPLVGITYPTRLMSGRGIPWENVSINATSWTTLATTASTRLNPQFGHATNTVLIMCGGSSDIFAGDSGAQLYADEVAYGNAARAAAAAAGGTAYVICTTLTGNSTNTGGQNTARLNHNIDLLADASSAFDGCPDLAASALSDWNNGTYYSDGLHWTVAGADLAASVVEPVLEALPGFPAG